MSFAASEGERPLVRSLSLQLTGWYLLVFLVSTGLLSAAISLEVRSSVHDSNQRLVSGALAAHKRAFEAAGTVGLRQLAESPRVFEEESLYLRVVGADGVTEFEYRSATSALGFEAAGLSPANLAPPYRSVRGTDGARWDLATAPLTDGRFLQLALRDERSESVLSRLRVALLVAWLLAIGLGLCGGFLLTRVALRPVRELTTTARQVIASGDLRLRVPDTSGAGELQELAHLFNGVLERNQALVQGMRDALDNVAHDLRTPLTRLRTGAEVALRDDTAAPRVRAALADAVEESDEVLGMLTSLMDITEAETGVMRLDLVDLDLSALAAACTDLYAHVAEERGVRIVSRLHTSLPVRGDRRRLHQAVANLLDNALKYTPGGGLVELSTHREDGWAVLVVQDNGIGIEPQDLPRIWTRLFRGDSSRSQRGLGLGLSFVKAIVAAHRGEIAAASRGAGSTFTLRLPLGVR